VDENAGTATFTVSLSAASGLGVTFNYASSDDTATAGQDYTAVSGSDSISAGATSTTIAVNISDDLLDELEETFNVTLSNAGNATIGDGVGEGTITDNDPTPALSINDVTVEEGDAGTTSVLFTVSLSAPSGRTVTVDYATADGTATTADNDYQAIPTTQITLDPGETSKPVTVLVNGDFKFEADETFTVNLSNAAAATIDDGSGLGTIENDDFWDFGDAPDPDYPTVLESNGARHVIDGPWLGDATDGPDAEPDGQPDARAAGDDSDLYAPANDDENGVTIPTLIEGLSTDITVVINGGGGYLDAWIDFDGDGTWAPEEKIPAGFLADGTHSVPVTVPLGSVPSTYGRFRISTTDGLGPVGVATDGEVEDYEVTISLAPTISDIPDQTIDEDTDTGLLPFTVDDAETPVADLVVTGSSGDPSLVPEGNILFGGSGANRTVTVTPLPDQTGTTTITVTVTDGDGASASDTFLVTVLDAPDPPTAEDNTVTTYMEQPYVFQVADFKFSDPDGDSLASVKITRLETLGSLVLDGVDVALDQVISLSDIIAGNLEFVPLLGDIGSPYDSFEFKVSDGTLESVLPYTMTINVKPLIIDDGDFGWSATGPGFHVNSDGAGAYNDHRNSNPGEGNTGSWTFTGLNDGLYLVSATWITHFVHAGNSPYTITPTGSGPTTVRVNQRAVPDDFTEGGIPWENLAVVEVIGGGGNGIVVVQLTDAGADGLVDADAIRLARAAEIVVLDDGGGDIPDGTGSVDFGRTDLGRHATRTITVRNDGEGRLTLGGFSITGSQFRFASPLPAAVPPGLSVTFDVCLGATSFGTFSETISFRTNDWDEGLFNFSLDATVAGPQPTVIDDGDLGYDPGGFLAGPKVEGYGGDVDYTPAHATRTARWTFSNLDAGRYQVSATWSPDYNRATNASYHINGGAAIVVNQRAAPADYLAHGARWRVLGEAEVAAGGGSIEVTLTAAGVDGLVIADAVRVVPVSSRVLFREGEFAVIDNGEPGTGGDSQGVSTWDTDGRTSFDGEYGYLLGDNSGHAATWTFEAVPGTYQVAVAWQFASYNRATNAPFTVTAGGNTLDVTVNQMLRPSADQLGEGVTYANGTAFQVLSAEFEVPAGTNWLEVSVTDHADSYVILDAVMVRVVSLAPPSPLLAGGAASGPARGGALTGTELSPLVAEAIARWSDSGLDAARVERLRAAEMRIADLPGTALAIASELAETVWIDVDGAGLGWFVDPTPAVDEEFRQPTRIGTARAVDGSAAEGIDLLSVLAHELGHLLGLEDVDPVTKAHDLMAATLPAGVRRVPAVGSNRWTVAAGDERAQTETASIGDAARDNLFARVGAWLEADPEDASDEADEETKLWFALFGPE
jgi:hypothetical protein